MEHYQIRYFLAVCRTLHFTRAAREEHVSQPALTKAIQKLEAELGAPLFIREGRRVQPTEFGLVMRDKLTLVVEARREAERAAKQFLAPPDVTLDVGVMCTIGPASLVGLLGRFRRGHPEINLKLHDVTSVSALDRMHAGDLDCALLAAPDRVAAPLRSRKLFTERMVVAFAPEHRFNAMRRVRFEELDGERYIDRLHCEFRDMFLAEVAARGMTLTVPYATEREDWIQSMIARGMGVCVLPEFVVREAGVRKRVIVGPALSRSVVLAYLPGREQGPGLRALLAGLPRGIDPAPGDTGPDTAAATPMR